VGRRSVWRHRDLRVAVLGRSVSALGDDLAVVALVLFAYDAGWGTAGVAAVFAATTLPWALGAPLAGRWADRASSRLVTSSAALVQAAVATVAALLLAFAPERSPVTVVAVLLAVGVLTLAQVAAGSAWQALVPRLVEPDEVPRAIALGQAGNYVAVVAAPGLAGLLVGSWGAQAALAADAVTFALLAAAALTVRTVRRPEPVGGDDSIWAGVTLVRADRLFSAVLGGVLVVLLVVQVVLVVDVFLLRGGFGLDARGYGFASLAVMGCGLLGALWAGRARNVRAQSWGIVAALGSASLCAALAGLAGTLWLAVLALCGVGVAFGALNVCVGAFTVSRTTDDVRGRAYATVAGTTQAATLVGLGAAAALGAAVGAATAFVLAGAVGTVVAAVVTLAVLRIGTSVPAVATAPPDRVVLPEAAPVE
jgi:MFS family permease